MFRQYNSNVLSKFEPIWIRTYFETNMLYCHHNLLYCPHSLRIAAIFTVFDQIMKQ